MGHKRICEKCGAEILKKWDNERHYGTCPECSRGVNFVIENPELRKYNNVVIEQENERAKKNALLSQYAVVTQNPHSGIKHVNDAKLARLIFEECNLYFKTIEDKDTGKREIYYYNGGSYFRGGDNKIKETVDVYLDDLTSIHHKNEAVDWIKHRNLVNRHDIEPPACLINLKNGIYDLKADKLIKHDPKYFFLNKIPIDYNPKAKCPHVEKFFKEVLYDEYIPVMQEMFGYTLYRRYNYHKAFLLYGGGRNGKTTSINLLKKFLGNENITARNLNDLMENRFSKADLYGKLANVGAEISGGALKDTSDFKHLTGDDTITGERKFFGSFTFENYAKLIFNANYIPYPKYDKSMAYFRRWIILVFPSTFDLDDKKTDPNILEKLTTKKELEGLLLWSIEGLKRLIKNKKFSYFDDENENEVGERYELLAKPEKQFITDNLKLSAGEIISVKDVFTEYEEWANKRRYPILNKGTLSRSMKRYLKTPELKCDLKATSINNKSVRVYENVTWKKTPTNSLRMDKIEKFDMPLSGKLKKLRKIVKENREAGYEINMDFLRKSFDDGFINKSIESGILIRLANGEYDVER